MRLVRGSPSVLCYALLCSTLRDPMVLWRLGVGMKLDFYL